MPRFLSFPYFGPNRRSDKRVVEVLIDFDESEKLPDQLQTRIRDSLLRSGISTADQLFMAAAVPDDSWQAYGYLLAVSAVALQQCAGHSVQFASAFTIPEKSRCVALVEHEDSITGMAAVKLAINILMDMSADHELACRSFSQHARERALPQETAAIIRALDARGVPWMQPEREPLSGHLKMPVVARRNGQLLIGRGTHTELLDGTFCGERASPELKALLGNPSQRRRIIESLGLAVTPSPVHEPGSTAQVDLLQIGGRTRVVARDETGQPYLVRNAHHSVLEAIQKLGARLGNAPMSMQVLTADITAALQSAGLAVVDFDLAPDLFALLGAVGDGSEFEQAVAEFVDYQFPDPGLLSIPVVAITGTNGKTSTSRMVAHILEHAEYKPGLVCTDGIFLNGKMVSKGDGSAFLGHARALTSKSVNAAVLESHHRGIAIRGFAFEHCDVAVCLNVTPEHLAPGQIETLEEMTEVKRALPERGKSVVLNADNEACMSMLPYLRSKRICLYSSTRSAEALAVFGDKGIMLCSVEKEASGEWIVITDHEKRVPVIQVSQMPCSIEGTARFLVENAQAAIAASYLAGVSPQVIAQAMSAFEMSHEITPGRLNIYRDLPFTAVIDYAHNPDGMARLVEFTDAMPVSGRRLLLLAGTGSRTDEIIAQIARTAAGHFDHYVCRPYPRLRGRAPGDVSAILGRSLLDSGVPEAAVSVFNDAIKARQHLLSLAGDGDLVVFQLSSPEFGDMHEQLVSMQKVRT